MASDDIYKRTDYEAVAASQTAQVIGTGAGGDGYILQRVVVSVATAATSTFTLIDDSTNIFVAPNNIPVGVYSIELGYRSAGPIKITTGAGVSLLCVGRFI